LFFAASHSIRRQLSASKATPAGRTADRRGPLDLNIPPVGRVRKRIEEVFGWAKSAAGFRKTRHRGLARVGCMFTLTATAYNLVRLPKLVGAAA
jgi:Transposase DDE domain